MTHRELPPTMLIKTSVNCWEIKESTCRCVTAVGVRPTEAAGPRQQRPERGKHVVQAVGDDDIVVN